MAKNILVTGGTGFLGSALIRRLVRDGEVVKVFDNGFRSNLENLKDLNSKIQYIRGDIRNFSDVDSAVKGVDTVIHLAAVNGTEFFYSKASLVLEVGVKGILNVIDACKKNGVKNLLVASSSEVYQTPKTIPTDETEPLVIPDVMNPRYSYGGSKIITELLVLNQSLDDFDRSIIFRPHNVYGPAMGWEHVIPQFIKRALDLISIHPSGTIPFAIQGSGSETRSYIHIDDMVDGICLLLDKGAHLNIYHIGNPQEISIKELVGLIFSHFERDWVLVPGALQPGSTQRRCPSIEKIKTLGFHPKIKIESGLLSVIDWYIHEIESKRRSYNECFEPSKF